MSNVVQLQSKRKHREAPEAAFDPDAAFVDAVKAVMLQSSAKDALMLLTDQLETAMQHARAIEPRMRHRGTRQAFADRIDVIQRMLDLTRVKILQL
ncbi:hypothetical protein [Bradyrhizobium sp.]|uniref:hypothetical protein n=1 Tax=Bradyrhizobium sp. TaxID=376 RepID=UPI002395E579|nr:hypothetical protein [Bradyrhizobium sp.]MDE2380362.1 hypothetical protein [Bradyrhizobium sp.]